MENVITNLSEPTLRFGWDNDDDVMVVVG
jgi:hypothetical protein